MKRMLCPVVDVLEVAPKVFVTKFLAPDLARTVRPGQFVTVKVDEGTAPYLRRPFSVYYTEGDRAEIIFQVVGRGTATLAAKRIGDVLDVIGPLGVPFRIEDPGYSTGILMGGGLGVAPLPLSSRVLHQAGKNVVALIGARTARQLLPFHLTDPFTATDDGTAGRHGTVVDLLREVLAKRRSVEPKIFACGPTPMLKAVAALALESGIPCEVSLEGSMGCGIGICQGCPVELAEGEKKYAMMCKDGPTFDVRTLRW
jgi:dihydroorotate dehydrogenase electron transfer subunit